MTLPEANNYVGRTIGKYRIVERIGKGGMAVVYKAYQESLDRYVAVKLMHSFLADEGEFLERFKREARAMGALKHPNIAAVYDFDVVDDTYFIVMEHIGGGSLKDELTALNRSGKRMPLARAIRYGIEMADALAYAHERGMVHRDIKPGNILLRPDGSAVLTDFGIAKMLGGATHTATGAMVGTPAYMAPEQGLGQLGDARSDVYALGILLYQLATGSLPFESPTPLAVVMMHVSEPLPRPRSFNPDLPLAVEAVIQRAAAKDPDDRYQTAGELGVALREVALAPEVGVADALPAGLLQGTPMPAPAEAPLAPAQDADVATRQSDKEQTVLRLAQPAPVRPPLPNLPPPESRTAKPASTRRTIPRWWLVVAALVVVIGGGGLALALRNRGGAVDTQPAGAPSALAASTVTPTASLTRPAPATATMAASPQAADLPTSTATVSPTNTATVPPTPTATPSMTPNATATFVAACSFSLALNGDQPLEATVGEPTELQLALANNGTCTWPAGWQLVDPLESWDAWRLPTALEPGGVLTLTLSLAAPDAPGSLAVSIVLADDAGRVLGGMVTANIDVVMAATATPRPVVLPTATQTPTPTATPQQATELGFSFSFNWCEYAGDEWRCELVITPYGGIGAPYTVWVFDADPPARYNGQGSFYHIVRGRRCFAWVNEIKVQDDGGSSLSRNLYFDPVSDAQMAPLFPGGGCTLP